MRDIVFGCVGTVLMGLLACAITVPLHVGQELSFLIGMPFGAIGMIGGMYVAERTRT